MNHKEMNTNNNTTIKEPLVEFNQKNKDVHKNLGGNQGKDYSEHNKQLKGGTKKVLLSS
jgi:hypothetical protein